MALILIDILQWPLYAAIPATLLCCGAVGLINGMLVGYLRLRAFLTTLVTLIVVRAIVDILLLKYAQPISAALPVSDVWDFMGEGTLLDLPFSLIGYLLIALVMHIVLSRTRPGWRIMAVGGSRRSAHNVGLPVRRIICGTYVVSGLLCGLAGILYAARSNSPGAEVGTGLEVVAITAAVLGGNSLGSTVTLDVSPDLLRKQMTIIGSWTFSTVGQADCAKFVADRGVAVDQLFTDRWRLDEAETAYRRFDAQNTGKGVFLF